MKQTAVGILRKVISSYKLTDISSEQMLNELLELVDNSISELEKQQIINAYVNNRYIDNSIPIKKDDAIKYYNETFKNK